MIKNESCPLCQKQSRSMQFQVGKYKVFSCDYCQLLYIDPYVNDFDSHKKKVAENKYSNGYSVLEAERHYLAEQSFYLRYFKPIYELCKTAKSVLDVGCGTGHLLELLSMKGINRLAGIELDSFRASYAKRKAGCPIFESPIEDFRPKERYEVALLINVLSHLPDFEKLFQSIRNILVDDGKIILKVGEFAPTVRRNDVFDWGIPSHLHFLGNKTIDIICERFSFEKIHHARITLSDEIFLKERFLAPGRSGFRNCIKEITAWTPGALALVKWLYNKKHKAENYSSLIVLRKKN